MLCASVRCQRPADDLQRIPSLGDRVQIGPDGARGEGVAEAPPKVVPIGRGRESQEKPGDLLGQAEVRESMGPPTMVAPTQGRSNVRDGGHAGAELAGRPPTVEEASAAPPSPVNR